eukprot:8984483-Pyramimonas_sp.AAC.1
MVECSPVRDHEIFTGPVRRRKKSGDAAHPLVRRGTGPAGRGRPAGRPSDPQVIDPTASLINNLKPA